MGNGIMLEHIYYGEKRIKKRAEYNQELYYPRVNDNSVYQKYGTKEPIMEAVNISETGVSFKSRIPLIEGDFLNFALTIENNPSFWCLAEVKWVRELDHEYLVGCEFYTLSQEHVDLIKSYVNTRE